MARKKQTKNNVPQFDTERRDFALHLIANLFVNDDQALMGITSRILEMGKYRLTAEMLPEDMKFERFVLRRLYKMQADNIVASAENMMYSLIVEFGEDTARGRLENLMSFRSTGDAPVTMFAFALGQWIEVQRFNLALADLSAKGLSGDYTLREMHEMAMKALTELAPTNSSVSEASLVEALDQFEDFQNNRQELFDSGKMAGPNFPWNGMNEKIPALKLGEMMTIMGQSKMGKTTVALILAYYWAVTLGYHVAYFHLETSRMSLIERFLSRKLKITTKSWRQNKARLDKEPVRSKFLDVKNQVYDQLRNTGGRLMYQHCPGITPSMLQAEVAKYKAQADAAGKELIVLVDYYTEIDWSELADQETAGYNAVATYLKNMAEADETRCYMVPFAQYGINDNPKAKRTAWGGSKIIMRSQVVINIERAIAEKDEPYSITDTKGRMIDEVDLLGQRIYYHRAGQPSSDAILNIMYANDDEPGPVPVKFVNGYYDIEGT